LICSWRLKKGFQGEKIVSNPGEMNSQTDSKSYKKIIFAVGGTGGHLFPAQALARELKENHHDILFAGGGLGSNQYFHKLTFPFREITSASPFRSNPFRAALKLLSGVRESFRLFNEFSPDCIIGFGSFYSFPILAAAKLRKIPYILVESNAHPGKVNRLFSRGAKVSAVQFEEAKSMLKGEVAPARVPFWSIENPSAHLDSQSAKKYFHLDPMRFTLLIFGGSQGAAVLNEAGPLLGKDLQVLHLCGKDHDPEVLFEMYKKRGITACVKQFEQKMHIALRAADLALCRSGASTLNELIQFNVPSILVPWPGATENHQYKNAKVFESKGGALLLEQSKIDKLPHVLEDAREKLSSMRACLNQEAKRNIHSLSKLVTEQLEGL